MNATYEMCWYDDSKTILVVDVNGQWMWQDIEIIQAQIISIINLSRHKQVDCIVRINEASIPRENAIPNMVRMMKRNSKKNGTCVFVVHNGILANLVELADKLKGGKRIIQRCRFTNNMEDAISILQTERTEDLEIHGPTILPNLDFCNE